MSVLYCRDFKQDINYLSFQELLASKTLEHNLLLGYCLEYFQATKGRKWRPKFYIKMHS